MSDSNPIPELGRRFENAQARTEEINRKMFELIHEDQCSKSKEHEQEIKALREERERSVAEEDEIRKEYFRTLK